MKVFHIYPYIFNGFLPTSLEEKGERAMNRQDLDFLKAQQKYPSVSILMRTHRTMPDVEKNRIVAKNLIAEAKERLLKEFSARDMKKLFANLDAIENSLDFTKEADGLALFVNEEIKAVYSLPFPVENRVTIDTHFQVRDILLALNRIPSYWVLALSEKPCRFFHGSGDILSEVVEPENDTMGISRDGFPLDYTKPHGKFQYSVGNALASHSPVDSHYFDDHKKVFFKKVDDLLGRFISVDKRPLFVLGAERNISLFESVTVHAIAGRVQGDFSAHKVQDVAKAVWPEVQKYVANQEKQVLADFDEAIGKLNQAFTLETVWQMAHEGRVKDLLVEENYAVPGMVEKDNPQRIMRADSSKTPHVVDDLVNLLIAIVQEKGGNVIFLKKGSLKDFGHIAAILRY